MLGIQARFSRRMKETASFPIPEEAARLVDSRTRALVLVTPNNRPEQCIRANPGEVF